MHKNKGNSRYVGIHHIYQLRFNVSSLIIAYEALKCLFFKKEQHSRKLFEWDQNRPKLSMRHAVYK
jgi:hypothetical protein